MLVRITMTDGAVYVSEFSKLGNLGRYFTRCMAQRKAINVWRIDRAPHPVTGESVAMRYRTLLNPEHVQSMYELDPVTQQPKADPVRTEGLPNYTVTEGDGSGLPVGTVVPRHREPAMLDTYIITGYDDAGVERRFVLPAAVLAEEVAALEESETEPWQPEDDENF